ncbi:Mu homology domain-containing protein [Endogone sp. FLAS-F59071]|nr:Mu homology domain-containing protein [Endogone sp. FLAS-F59071]|eukprot:RUS17273.1 Mu homology domain-containing protein [Endogone sp. FLAS-F59071]
MINSLFVINKQGKILVEKHWRGLISRQIVDYFNDQVVKFFVSSSTASTPLQVNGGTGAVPAAPKKETSTFTQDDVPPVIETTKYLLMNVWRGGLTWLCPVEKEVDPLLVFEFIHRIIDILTDYLGDVSESTIRENFVTVYQLLEEMMDYGYPLTTEPNALKEVIMAPTIINKVMNTVAAASGVAPKLPHGTLSSFPWRKAGVKYTTNEIYFDVVEEIDAIVDSNGAVVSCEANGQVNVNCKLTGMPDLQLSFVNPRILDDASFHPCVSIQKFETDKVLSFVPPDGHFKLMSYRVNLPNPSALPILVKQQMHATKNGGKFDLTLQARSTEGKSIENVLLVLPMAKSVTSVNATCNVGGYMFDPVSKTIRWEVSKIIPKERTPMLSGTFSSSEENPETGHTVSLDFQINMYTVSGLKVDTLRVFHEGYKPYKVCCEMLDV